MSVLNDNTAFRKAVLGNVATKASGTLASSAIPVFTVAGGEVMITSVWLKVTTSITAASTVALQNNPTTGDTMTLVTATDLGTSDTLAGGLVGLDTGTTAASSFRSCYALATSSQSSTPNGSASTSRTIRTCA